MGDDGPVRLGAGIFALHDPHRGYEREFHHFYERDHMYAAAILAPWTIAGQRFVATAELKAMRYPEEGPFGPVRDGSFLTMYWITEDHLGDQQAWVNEQMQLLTAAGRQFAERSVQTATTYDYLGSWERDAGGVPPFLALDHRYESAVWAVVERSTDESVTDLAQWLAGTFFPARFASSPVALATMFTPRPKEPWWPAAAPEVPGVGERVVVAFFLEADVHEAFTPWFEKLGDDLAAVGRARALFVAPFIPTIPGTDAYIDQLW
jgi:hypothetical protein